MDGYSDLILFLILAGLTGSAVMLLCRPIGPALPKISDRPTSWQDAMQFFALLGWIIIFSIAFQRIASVLTETILDLGQAPTFLCAIAATPLAVLIITRLREFHAFDEKYKRENKKSAL